MDVNNLDSPLCTKSEITASRVRHSLVWGTRTRTGDQSLDSNPILHCYFMACLCFFSLHLVLAIQLPQTHVCGLYTSIDSLLFSLAAVLLFAAWHSVGKPRENLNVNCVLISDYRYNHLCYYTMQFPREGLQRNHLILFVKCNKHKLKTQCISMLIEMYCVTVL